MEIAFNEFRDTMRTLEAQCDALVNAMREENKRLRLQLPEANDNHMVSENNFSTSQTVSSKGSSEAETPRGAPKPETPRDAVTQGTDPGRLQPAEAQHHHMDSVPVEYSLPINSSYLLTPGRQTEQLLSIPQTPPRSNRSEKCLAEKFKAGPSDIMMSITSNESQMQQKPNQHRTSGTGTGTVSFGSVHMTTWSSDGKSSVPSASASKMRRSWTESSVPTSSKLNELMSTIRGGARFKRQSMQNFQVREEWKDNKNSGLSLQRMLTSDRRDQMQFSQLTGLSASVSSSNGFSQRHRFILHPQSKVRTSWTLVCVAFLLHDFIMVPFGLGFDQDQTQYFRVMGLITAAFWTLDIIVNFISGLETYDGVQMEKEVIARSYCRSWFAFDLILVVQEWLTYALVDVNFSVFRMARYARLLRLLRLVRLLRLAKWKEQFYFFVYSLHLSQVHLIASQGCLSMFLSCMIVIHLFSCFWYYVGNSFENGWVMAYRISGDAGLDRLYIISVHWSFSRLQGLTNNHDLVNVWEMVVDSLLIFLSLLLVSFYIGRTTVITIAWANDSRKTMWNRSVDFVQRRKIPKEVKIRLLKTVETGKSIRAAEIAHEESTLLDALPLSMRHDLVFEARRHFLMKNSFFRDLVGFNRRAVRHICNRAITSSIFVPDELVFAYADACSRMIIIDNGKFEYVQGRKLSTSRTALKRGGANRPSSSNNSVVALEAADSICEPVLWTMWEHMGFLVALQEAAAFSLDAAEFVHVIVQYTGPHMHAVRYAKHFVWNLSHCKNLCDLSSFPDLSIESLDDDVFYACEYDHFIFISHYKRESGTEATLIRDLLNQTLLKDLGHPANHLRSPIFIDSEDLKDLAQLKEHVVGSCSLLFLLTPGVLSRPWCLIEMVTAVMNDVSIVLVEVQRPGSSYNYPDEAFYADVLAGRFLNQSGLELLTREGFTLKDVESSIRQAFQKIACPFSPHKSKAIRDAELHDILERCNSSLYDRDTHECHNFK